MSQPEAPMILKSSTLTKRQNQSSERHQRSVAHQLTSTGTLNVKKLGHQPVISRTASRSCMINFDVYSHSRPVIMTSKSSRDEKFSLNSSRPPSSRRLMITTALDPRRQPSVNSKSSRRTLGDFNNVSHMSVRSVSAMSQSGPTHMKAVRMSRRSNNISAIS